MKPKNCKYCEYWREPTFTGLGSNIPGSGHWCSCTPSPKGWTRVAPDDGCSEFRQRGQRAPLWMIGANVALGVINGALRKLPPGQAVSPEQAKQVLRLVAEVERKTRRMTKKKGAA